MAKRRTAVQEVMDSPITLGGFTWRWGLVWGKLASKPRARDLCMMGAESRGVNPNVPDTRIIPEEKAEQLWDAIGDGDTQMIDRIVNEFWEIRPA